MRRVLLLFLVAAGLSTAVLLSQRRPRGGIGPVDSSARPLPAASTHPSTPVLTTRYSTTRYSDWLQRQPGFAQVQPEKHPLPLFDAAHLLCRQGALIDSRGGVWIIDSDAPSFAEAATTKTAEPNRVTRDPVVAVFWLQAGARPQAFAVAEAEQGGYELLAADGSRRPLERRDYDWRRLRVLDDYCVVPCPQAVVAIRPAEVVAESIYEFRQAGDEPAQLVQAENAVLAFLPQHQAKAAPAPIVTYEGGAWRTAGARQDWRGPALHLRPLADTTFVQFIRPGAEPGVVKLEILPRIARQVDRKAVLDLIAQLGSDLPAERDQAELRLDAPDNWSIIEELLPGQPPESRLRMLEILARRNTCSIGRWEIRGQRLVLAQRLAQGAIFLAPEGLTLPDEGRAAGPEKPTYLALMDDEMSVLPAAAEAALSPAPAREGRIFRAEDDWLIPQADEGAGTMLAGLQQQLTRGSEAQFSEFRGVGSSAYLFANPGRRECLLIDRLAPDPTPRLPVWEIQVNEGETGWDSAGWPAMKKVGAWSLRPAGWKPLSPQEHFFQAAEEATSASQQTAASASATDPTKHDVLVTCAATTITLTRPGSSGRTVEMVPLPPAAQGSLTQPRAVLKNTSLYLYNEPGRVIELVRGAQGWELKRSYQQDIPRVQSPRRFWLDPAGRLCLAWENNLAIFFPTGRIPPEILDLMPHEQVQRLRFRAD